MFIPFSIRHSYKRWPVVTCLLAASVLFILLLFSLPGWMIKWILEASHEEVLSVLGFDPESHTFFHFFSYTLIYPNSFLLLLDIAALALFGWAVERRLGWWKFAILFFVPATIAASVHGFFYPDAVIAGGSAGVFGVMAAGILIYGVSDLEGFALFAWPAPPKAFCGVTSIWALHGILAYMAGIVCWTILAPGDDVLLPSLWALGAGFLSGALITVAYLGSKIPILNPGELDPSTILRNEE